MIRKESINFPTRQITKFETVIEIRVELTPLRKDAKRFCVGKALALTVMLETGPISHFEKVSNYMSYCRKVSSKWLTTIR
jgi:transposase